MMEKIWIFFRIGGERMMPGKRSQSVTRVRRPIVIVRAQLATARPPANDELLVDHCHSGQRCVGFSRGYSEARATFSSFSPDRFR